MLRTIFVALQILLLYNGICQAPQSASIIIQNNQQQPIDNAVVRVLSIKDSTVITSAITNASGVVSFNPLAAGKYIIQVSFTGLTNKMLVLNMPSKLQCYY